MRLRSVLLAVIVGVLAPSIGSAQTNPLVGAWERISDINAQGIQQQPPTPPAFLILSADGFYSQTAIPAARTKVDKPLEELTKAELIARFNRVVARRGTYTIVGNRLTRHDISNINPSGEGTDQIQLFKIEGDTLILTTPDPNSKAEVRFRRMKKTT
jgi:hypothetical protein